MKIKHKCKECKKMSENYKKLSDYFKKWFEKKWSEHCKKKSEYYATKCRCEE